MQDVAAELPAIAATDFKAAMRGLASAVCVITSRHESRANGMTATAVCSVSAEPPSILVVVNRSNRSHAIIHDSGVFAVHVLAKGQEPLATHFAGRPEHPFVGVPVRPGATDVPTIEDCETVLECVVAAETDFGTHTIVVGRIVAARYSTAEPLLYCHGQFGSMA